MKDSYGRAIDYMRLSITDMCNLRCSYCHPDKHDKKPSDDVLSMEEILELVRRLQSAVSGNLRSPAEIP